MGGVTGATGATGAGVPVGGSAGEVLAKNSGTDYDTHWIASGGSGTVTHTTGALTADLPMFGAGTADSKVGTKQGTGTMAQMASGTAGATGNVLAYDANGNAVDGGAKVPTSRTISTTAPLTGGGDLTANRTLVISNLTGDTGSGGAAGAAPAPAAGDAAAGKYLKADGTWEVPPGGGSGPRWISLQVNGPLTVNADISAHVLIPASGGITPTACVAELKSGPTGSNLVAVIKVNGATYLTLTFVDASWTYISATPSGTIPASAIISLAITSIGSTASGSDLSISLSW